MQKNMIGMVTGATVLVSALLSGTALAESDGVRNIIMNGDFSEAANPGYPNNWTRNYRSAEGIYDQYTHGGLWDYVKELLDEEEIPVMITDSTTSVQGRKSLKIHNPSERLMLSASQRHRALTDGQVYTMSLYMKSDEAGEGKQVNVVFGNVSGERFNVTTEWQRYTYTFEAKLPSPGYRGHFHIYWRNAGTLWIDSVQVEEGESANDYAHTSTY